MAKSKPHPDYDVSDNTYNLKRQNLKDKGWDTEIGDRRNKNKFVPRVKIQRWDDAFIEIGMHPSLLGGGDTVTHDGDAVVWSKGIYTAKFYDWASDPDDEEGNGSFEWEFILASEPPVNSFSVDIRKANVVMKYQPILTPQEMLDDNVFDRPDRVQGSYAVYHTSKRWHKQGEIDYQIGKIGHLYRPLATDDNGDTIWGTWNDDAEITDELTLTVDATWLANATYPVTIDPTFGYTTAGATSLEMSQILAYANGNATYQYAASAGDTVTTLWWYGKDYGGADCNLAIYDTSSNEAVNLIGSGINVNPPNSSTWRSVSVSIGLSGSTTYTIAIAEMVTNGLVCWADSGDNADTDRDNISGGVFDDPYVRAGGFNWLFSLKADYTVSSGTRRVMVVS